jgi:hypothetical protein
MLIKKQYEKATYAEVDRLPYLRMTIIKKVRGFEICMKLYIDNVLTPAKLNLFTIRQNMKEITDEQKFHTVIARLLYLRKQGHPDILLALQLLCTRVKAPMIDDK